MTYPESRTEIPAKIRLAAEDILNLSCGKYKVIGDIGKGGFAHIYQIQNERSESFALKLMDLWLIRPDEYEDMENRFRQEFQSGKIDSPFIVQSYCLGRIQSNPYIIMDYCPGGTLATRISEFKKELDYTSLGMAILKGLLALHQQGVIHRDLKPENVLFDQSGKPRLADFGISGFLNKRLTSRNFIGLVSQVWGTPLYSPPEQLDHGKAFKLTAPTMDIFSFGVLMYEVITGGKHPFGIHQMLLDNPSLFLQRVMAKEYERLQYIIPNVSPTWLKVIEKCLEPKPSDRYASIREVLDQFRIPDPAVSSPIHSVSDHISPCLKVIQGEEVGHIYPLPLVNASDTIELRMGWKNEKDAPENDIGITEKRTSYISSKHATLYQEKGKWYIRDGQWDSLTKQVTFSLNGTYINYKRLIQDQSYSLSPGDIISVGETILKFQMV